ncbi:MBL fold metallo-hydrolase [Clostridium peptidivorans]|uniref:MBL fold metallo-hydrolase n=1 Tax=Clostridium peptidivorans TaxID=100174 RepID=UPI000BE3483E|nr:MBL fold metallo-hydrolase [Clostridium peptidivorans]
MEIKQISGKSTAYVYDDIENYLTSVFLIEKKSKIYLIDTFCGSNSIKPIINEINKISQHKEVIVINTHFHWDHVWGNCSFKGRNIISHEMCRKLLDKFWEEQINKNSEYIFGEAEKHLPNITFKEKIIFEDDGIELFYSPGHTIDSISIFDHEEKILYVGDNLEKPIIYVESDDVDTYINTLKNYLSYNPKKIVASHTLEITKEDLLNTIKYLKSLQVNEEVKFESEYERKIHKENLKIVHKMCI